MNNMMAMQVTVEVGKLGIRVPAQPLTQEAFAPFGDVITNPRPHIHPAAFSAHTDSLPSNAISANQGTAIQYRDVSSIKNFYSQAPSGRGSPKMSMFVCAARELQPSPIGFNEATFNVSLMERHPYTTQTFTPVSSSASQYLVIVAPNLPPGPKDSRLPVPTGDGLPGRGLPDVLGLKAFVGESNQAVTYGVGTWHAPMVTLGQPGTALDFVVFQFASGEAIEDCQIVPLNFGPKRTKSHV